MKKIILFAVAMLMSLAANAQFEQGKGYLGASLSSFDIGSQAKKFHLGFDAKVGYMFFDDVMFTAQVGYDHLKDSPDTYNFGLGGRYYIVQNGLYLGATINYKHYKFETEKYNDFMPGVQVGYAFFISRTVTIEPELYMDFSTKKFENSCYGLRIGVGVYLFKDQKQN